MLSNKMQATEETENRTPALEGLKHCIPQKTDGEIHISILHARPCDVKLLFLETQERQSGLQMRMH